MCCPAQLRCSPTPHKPSAPTPLAGFCCLLFAHHTYIQGKPFCLVLNKADDVDQQEQIGEALTQLLDVLPAGAWHRSQQVNTCCQAVQDAHPAPQHQQQQQHQGVTVLQTSALTGAGMQALLQWLMCTAGWDCNTLLYLQGGMTCLRELLTVQGVAP